MGRGHHGILKGGSAGGDGGVATSPAEAVEAVVAFLLRGGFAAEEGGAGGPLKSLVERITKTWTVTFEGDQRIAEAVERHLKMSLDTVWEMADPEELGMDDRDFDILADVASVVLTDEAGNLIADD